MKFKLVRMTKWIFGFEFPLREFYHLLPTVCGLKAVKSPNSKPKVLNKALAYFFHTYLF